MCQGWHGGAIRSPNVANNWRVLRIWRWLRHRIARVGASGELGAVMRIPLHIISDQCALDACVTLPFGRSDAGRVANGTMHAVQSDAIL